MKKKILIGCAVAVLAVAGIVSVPFIVHGCSSGQNASSVTITMSSASEIVEAGDCFSLSASVSGSNGELVWKSSDPGIASYANGLVTGVSAGECDISASIGRVSATCHVTVTAKDGNIYSISTVSAFHVEKGTTPDITAEIHCLENGTDRVITLPFSCSSSDENVFTVENGKICPVSHGTAELTITTEKAEKTVPVVVYDSFVDTPEEFLNMLADREIGNSYFLTSDLDFSGTDYLLSSHAFSDDDTETFKGSFEGHGHTIKNITIDCTAGNSFSLLGNLCDAAVKDVNFMNVRFTHSSLATKLSGLAGFFGGINSLISNVRLDVSYDLSSASSGGCLLFSSFQNAPGIYESPYSASMDNVLVDAEFPNCASSDIGFSVSSAADECAFENVYVYSEKILQNPAKSPLLFSDSNEMIYEIVASESFGSSWIYPMNEMTLPSVREDTETLSDIVLSPMTETNSLSGYSIVQDYPFTTGYLGQAYGDYGADVSGRTNQLLVNWHSFGATTTNPLADFPLSDYSSFLFYIRSNESDSSAYLEVKKADGSGAASTLSYSPDIGKTWVSVEMKKDSDGTWSVHIGGSTVESGYQYTNLNEFDYCFSQRRYYVSELFAK